MMKDRWAFWLPNCYSLPAPDSVWGSGPPVLRTVIHLVPKKSKKKNTKKQTKKIRLNHTVRYSSTGNWKDFQCDSREQSITCKAMTCLGWASKQKACQMSPPQYSMEANAGDEHISWTQPTGICPDPHFKKAFLVNSLHFENIPI